MPQVPSSRKVLVTGSSRGIGHAIAAAFVKEGDTVFLNGRDQSTLDRAVMQLGLAGAAEDVTQIDGARRLTSTCVSALGGIDVLVCNVGSGASVQPGEETAEEWQRVFALNLFATTNMVEAARPHLVASKGTVVCISSICGVESIPGAPVTYSAAKAALNAFVRGVSRPLGKSGVRINAIAPGNILFDGSVWGRRMREDADAVGTMLEANVALGKLGEPDDVAQLAVYLASEKANFVTGSVWTIDGGQVRSF